MLMKRRRVEAVSRVRRRARGRVHGARVLNRQAVQQQQYGNQDTEGSHANSLHPPAGHRKR